MNSTALAILLARGLPQYQPWSIIFADTGEEKPQTYAYIRSRPSLYAWMRDGIPPKQAKKLKDRGINPRTLLHEHIVQ